MNEWIQSINEWKWTNKQIQDKLEKESLNKCTKHLNYGTNKQANERQYLTNYKINQETKEQSK